MDRSEDRLLAILSAAGALTDTDIRMAQVFCDTWKTDVFDTIQATNMVSQGVLTRLLADALELPVFGPGDASGVDEELLARFPYEDARRAEAMPVARLDGGAVKAIIANPVHESHVALLKEKLGPDIALYVAERRVVRKMIDDLYPIHLQLANIISCL